jgi:exo-beta-1,3-glucanase (GH17 family)
MERATNYAQKQYEAVKAYVESLNIQKPIHIGETGWASASNGHYGPIGTNACDEYKQGLYYHAIREWTNQAGISCFFFEAFDEPWKGDPNNASGAEKHWGIFFEDRSPKPAAKTLLPVAQP